MARSCGEVNHVEQGYKNFPRSYLLDVRDDRRIVGLHTDRTGELPLPNMDPWVPNPHQILTFFCKSYMQSTANENKQTFDAGDRFTIRYYLEDKTVQIIAHSNLTLGGLGDRIFLQRVVGYKGLPGSGSALEYSDFIGKTVEINGNEFIILECDKFTNDYLSEKGLNTPHIISARDRGMYGVSGSATKSAVASRRASPESAFRPYNFTFMSCEYDTTIGEIKRPPKKYKIVCFPDNSMELISHAPSTGKAGEVIFGRDILKGELSTTPLANNISIGGVLKISNVDLYVYACDDLTRRKYPSEFHTYLRDNLPEPQDSTLVITDDNTYNKSKTKKSQPSTKRHIFVGKLENNATKRPTSGKISVRPGQEHTDQYLELSVPESMSGINAPASRDEGTFVIIFFENDGTLEVRYKDSKSLGLANSLFLKRGQYTDDCGKNVNSFECLNKKTVIFNGFKFVNVKFEETIDDAPAEEEPDPEEEKKKELEEDRKLLFQNLQTKIAQEEKFKLKLVKEIAQLCLGRDASITHIHTALNNLKVECKLNTVEALLLYLLPTSSLYKINVNQFTNSLSQY